MGDKMETMTEKVGSGELCGAVLAYHSYTDYAKKVISELEKVLKRDDIITVRVSIPYGYKAIDFRVLEISSSWWYNLGTIRVENIKTGKARDISFRDIISIAKYEGE